MIINALSEFYKILAEDENSEIAPRFFSKVEAKYEVVIDKNGELVNVIPLIDEKGRGKECIVPEQSGRTAAGVPYFMCDGSQYVFGCTRENKDFITGKNEVKSFESTKNLHNEVLKDAKGDHAKAILNFLNNWDIYKTIENRVIKGLENEKKSCLDNVLLVFRVDTDYKSLHDDEEIKALWIKYCEMKQSEGDIGVCSISGNKGKISRVHPSIKGLGFLGGKSLAALTTFKLDAFRFYDKKQGLNAQVSESVAFEYTTMLNELIKNNNYNIRMGDETLTLFWAYSKEGKYNALASLMMSGDENKLDKYKLDKNTIDSVKQEFKNFKNGIFSKNYDPNTPFYILSISPNASRVVIKYFYKSTFGNMVKNMVKHYEDTDVARRSTDTYDMIPLWKILNATKRDTNPGAKSNEKLNKMILNGMLQAIIEGKPYPRIIYNLVLERIKANDEINRERASIIKGFINRLPNNKEEITVSLNEDSRNTAYVLGRLFATLERIQQRSLNFSKDAKTIKNSYFASACSTPSVVFPRLLKLAQIYMSKVDSGRYFMEKEIEDIISLINLVSLPNHLSLEDQGTFIMGYYHQKDYVDKKIEKAKEDKKNA